jgi:hypothetical protein
MMQISCQFEIRLAQKIAEFYACSPVCLSFRVVLMKNQVNKTAFMIKIPRNSKKSCCPRFCKVQFESMKKQANAQNSFFCFGNDAVVF